MAIGQASVGLFHILSCSLEDDIGSQMCITAFTPSLLLLLSSLHTSQHSYLLPPLFSLSSLSPLSHVSLVSLAFLPPLSLYSIVFLVFSLFLSPLPSPLSPSVFSLLGLLPFLPSRLTCRKNNLFSLAPPPYFVLCYLGALHLSFLPPSAPPYPPSPPSLTHTGCMSPCL